MARNKILLIDDEQDFLEIMGQRVESWGYELVVASCADEAMKAFGAEKPDAIILDYVMPDINGVELLRKIRELNKNIPVIMFTAYPDEKSIKGSEELKVSAFIPKLSVFTDAPENLKTALSMALKREK